MIHKYFMNGFYIVLDVNSGAVHVTDEAAYDVLDYYENESVEDIIGHLSGKYSEEVIREAYEELTVLRDAGELFSEDIYEGMVGLVNQRNPVVKAMCLLVTHDCNLTCEYCFAEEGEYHCGTRGLMDLETGKRAVDMLIEKSGARKSLEIDFFGGEPLMNMEVVKGIVEYAHSREQETGKKFRFTMTTNGLLLNDKNLAYINEHMENLVISLDGRKQTNDRIRRLKNGGSSYDVLMPKFKRAAESRNQDNYYIRGTFTRYNTDFSADVLHLADEGFKQISVEPVVGAPELPYSLKEEDLPQIFAEYEKLALEILERRKNGSAEEDFNFFHFMIDLTGGPCIAKRLVGCGAGTEYLAVTANGDLYPCHQFAGIEEFKLGNVYDGITRPEMRHSFESCNVYAKPACRKCWARFYCSGGCAANAHNFDGDIMGVYEIGCQLQRKRTECAIMMKAAEAAMEFEAEEAEKSINV